MKKNHIKLLGKIFWLILIGIAYSCGNSKSDFKQDQSGLWFRVIEESESKVTVNEGDYLELKLKYRTETDSVLFNSEEFGAPFKMQVEKTSHLGGCFEDALLMMNPGDNYEFKIVADSFYLKTKQEKLPNGVKMNSDLLFDIQIIRKISDKEIKKERILFEEKMKEQEQLILEQYIEDNKIEEIPLKSGMYYIEDSAGKGKMAVSGNILTVHYTGKFINGKIFDSSYNRNEPFSFKLGEHQVIAGWEEGFSYMKKGGKAVFIIPSELAYGKEGYSTIIPPYTSLIFEVELLEIKK